MIAFTRYLLSLVVNYEMNGQSIALVFGLDRIRVSVAFPIFEMAVRDTDDRWRIESSSFIRALQATTLEHQ